MLLLQGVSDFLLDIHGGMKLRTRAATGCIFNFDSLIAPRVWIFSEDTPICTPLIAPSCCVSTFKNSCPRPSPTILADELDDGVVHRVPLPLEELLWHLLESSLQDGYCVLIARV